VCVCVCVDSSDTAQRRSTTYTYAAIAALDLHFIVNSPQPTTINSSRRQRSQLDNLLTMHVRRAMCVLTFLNAKIHGREATAGCVH